MMAQNDVSYDIPKQSEYVVKRGDSVSGILKKQYSGPSTVARWKLLAKWNNLSTKTYLIKSGQRLELYPIIVARKKDGSKTTVKIRAIHKKRILMPECGLSSASIELGLEAISKAMSVDLIFEMGMHKLPSPETIIREISRNGKSYSFSNECSVVLDREQKEWFLDLASAPVSWECKMQDIQISEYFDLRTVNCKSNGLYFQIVKRDHPFSYYTTRRGKIKKVVKLDCSITKKSFDLYAFMISIPLLIPPPEPLYGPSLVSRYKKMLAETKLYMDLSTGQFYQDYDDGARDMSTWLYARLAHDMFRNSLGLHSIGIGYNGSYWDGDWHDPNDPYSAPYYFEGVYHNPHLEWRIHDNNGREWFSKIGYLGRKDEGYRADEWGIYETTSKFEGYTLGVGLDDNSRYGKTWFSRVQFSATLSRVTSASRKSYYTDKNGRKALDEKPENINGISGKFNIDLFSFSDGLATLSINTWGQVTRGGIKTGKFTPMIGFFGNSVKVGYEWTWTGRKDGSSTGKGFAWELCLLDLYEYMTKEDAVEISNEPIKADDLFVNSISTEAPVTADELFSNCVADDDIEVSFKIIPISEAKVFNAEPPLEIWN